MSGLNLSSFTPTLNATEVPRNTKLTLIFDKEVEKGTGNITVTDGSDTITIDVSTENVMVSGTQATVTLTSNLKNSTPYYVNIDSTCFTSGDGSTYDGISDSATWKFTTVDADVTAPTVSSVVPDNLAQVNANETTKVVITFSETIFLPQSDYKNLSITGGSTGPQTVLIDADTEKTSNSITINLPKLEVGTTYSLTLPQGSVVDEYKNGSEEYSWSFTTEKGKLTATVSPTNGSSNIELNTTLSLVFNEEVEKGTGNITLTGGSRPITIDVSDNSVVINGKNATITLDSNLEYNTEYDVTVDETCFTSTSKKYEFSGITSDTWKFTTKKDKLTATLTPSNGSSEIETIQSISMTFNEPVQKGTGNITITGEGEPIEVSVASEQVSISGSTVTVNLSKKLDYFTKYSVTVPSSCFTSTTGDYTFEGITEDNWKFTTKKGVLTASLAPILNSNNIDTNTTLSITFDQSIQKGTGNITLTSSNSPIEIDVSDEAVSISDKTVTITLSEPLDYFTEYSVAVPNTCFTSSNGKYIFEGIQKDNWKFTTKKGDLTYTVSPTLNATEVEVNSQLVVTFPHNVSKGTGNITITGDTEPINIDVSSEQVSVSSTTVTITLSEELKYLTEYSVTVPNTCFTSENEKYVFTGISAESWKFTTKKGILQYTVSPETSSVDISIQPSLSITFDQPIQKGVGTIKLYYNGENTVDINVSSDKVNVASTQVTITTDALSYGTEYSVSVPNTCFTSTDGKYIFEGIQKDNWKFTTVKGVLQYTLTPTDDSSEISIPSNLVITFDQNVQKGTGNITITGGTKPITIEVSDSSVSVQDKVVTISSVQLDHFTAYSVTVPNSCFTSTDGRYNFAGISAENWNFTTVKGIYEVTLVPELNSTNISKDSSLSITFNDSVQKGTGNIIITGGTEPIIVDVISANVTINDKTAKIAVSEPFAYLTKYSVTVPNTCFVHPSDKYVFEGITSEQWAFTIEKDMTPPKLVSTTPSDNATDVKLNQAITLTFDKNIKLGSGKVKISYDETEEEIQSQNLVVTNRTLTITRDLEYSKLYTITLEASAVLDTYDNSYSGSSFSFTTMQEPDTIKPVITKSVPANDDVNASTTPVVTLTFSENVVAGSGKISLNNEELEATSDKVSILDNVATIKFTSKLIMNKSYDVVIQQDFVKDMSGNSLDAATIHFTTYAPVIDNIEEDKDSLVWLAKTSLNNEAPSIIPQETLTNKQTEQILKEYSLNSLSRKPVSEITLDKLYTMAQKLD